MRKHGRNLDEYRVIHPTHGASDPGSLYGFFVIERPTGTLRITSSGLKGSSQGDAGRWEHVSVSLIDRCPTWEEMSFVKDLFWTDTEAVFQFHPPKHLHINVMPHCLHLWKPEKSIRLPPSMAIGLSAEQMRSSKRGVVKREIKRTVAESLVR